MNSRFLFFFSCLAAFGTVFLAGCKPTATVSTKAPDAPAIPVVTAVVTRAAIPVEISVVGSVEASETVQIKSQVAGQILKVLFQEGQTVQKGDLLFQLDEQPFRQALTQFEAAVARDRGALRQAEAVLNRDNAQAKLAKSEAERYAELQKSGIISATQYEQLKTAGDVAQAGVAASRAAIESAQANLANDLAGVERAKLDISYCSVRSPITGRAGMLLVHAGNLVKVNDVPLVVINRIAPVFVSFNVPERHLTAIRRLYTSGRVSVRATLRDQPDVVANGVLSVIDNAVDASTGTIRLKAKFENANSVLWPGQFADVVLGLGSVAQATLVPAESVQPGQKGPMVYRVKPDMTVEIVQVTTGESVAGKLQILSGVEPGDVLVTDGQLRLSAGAKVKKGVDPTAGVVAP
ncbi:efflux RND transporter periplasmic adaptor subunit [Bryobacter aggregatus]|uniref:efflux RND transporter periplasmic adaptor subunit n=1 Tax=Bryobacter aggregatus TaxID=360054 RepID=UPI00068BF3B1|nr:efflux RND transporter periplasmic adaptor subunit [Bryobacter aggregatus]